MTDFDKFMDYFDLFMRKLFRYILKPFSFLPAFIMIYIIFSFSAQTGTESSSLSTTVSRYIVLASNKLLDKNWSAEQLQYYVESIHPYVRKTAHVTEYFALAISIAFPLYVYRLRGFLLVLVAGTICVGIACLDEYSQSFIPGRGPSKRDVLIDSIGIFPGIYVARIIGFIGRKTVFKFLSLEENRKLKRQYKEAQYERTLHE